MEGGVMRTERRAGWMERGGGPRGRMPSCPANERQAVEAPSTLLTSSFVHHSRPSHAPHLSLSDTQNTLLLKYRAGRLFRNQPHMIHLEGKA